MARLFDGINDSLTATVDLSAVNKFTLSLWLYWDAYASDNHLAMEHTADAGAGAGWYLNPNLSTSANFQVYMQQGLTVATFTRPSAATWHHYAVQFDTSTSPDTLAVWVDGASQSLSYAAQGNSGNFANDTLNFMCRNNASLFAAGRMAEVAIWPGVLLDAGEITALAKRFAPPLIRPTTRAYYWPLMGRDATEIERNFGANATVNGAVQTDHPAIIYPSRAYIKAQTAAPPVVVPGSFAAGWAHSWVNPAGVAHPASVVGKQHLAVGPAPPFDLMGATTMQWLGNSTTLQSRAPAWPSAHLVRQAPTVPFYRGDIGWLPVGGVQPQSPLRYPPPPATGFIARTTGFATFPHMQAWSPAVAHSRFNYLTASALVDIAPLPPDPVLPPPVASVTCALTLGELKQRCYEQLDDDGTYYTGNEVRHALNAAANLFALLTLCKEKTASFTTTAAGCFHVVSLQLSDYIVPLRVTTAAGARIRPATIHELDGLASDWRATAGTPTRYIAMGYDMLALTPQYAGATAIRITYAATPTAMAADTDTADIPEEQHVWLVDYACWWLRLKEGGQELANATEWLQRFITAARKYGEFVRRRSYGQKYDAQPFDLASFDMGRLDITPLNQRLRRENKP